MTRIATFAFVVGVLGLFWLDRDRAVRTSKALWIPVLWLLITESRPVSMWLQMEPSASSPGQYLDGSPADRLFFSVLLAVGAVVLAQRRGSLVGLIQRNAPILLFFAYCAVSVAWSDYSEVSFKRWTKALGDLVMIFVVLTETNRTGAIKRLLACTAFLLVPLSILLIKYYPDLGRAYLPWVWTPVCVGVTTNKNTLGMVTMVLGLGSLWRILQELTATNGTRKTKPMIAHGVILTMTFWLLWKADSATSLSCFVMGGGIMAVTSLSNVARKTAVVHLLVAFMLFVSFSAVFLDLGSGLVETLGRDPTLTGRTEIWNLVLPMVPSPLFGAGFESFWLGKRLDKIWNIYWWHPNEAHNGYIEVYLNLGAIGIVLLGLLIVTGYRRVVTALRRDSSSSIWLAYFVVALAYNFTEAAFRVLHPVWFFFLFAAIAAREVAVRAKPSRTATAPAFASREIPCLEEV